MTRPLGFTRYDDWSGGALGLVVPKFTVLGLIQVESGSIRWRDDGHDPTPGVGMMLDGELRYDGDLRTFRMISLEDDTIVNVSCYGPGLAPRSNPDLKHG